jgi:hypothetical protein
MNAPHSFAAAALIVLAVTPEVQAQSMFDQMVAKKCAAAMQADFASAGKVPPAGLIDTTCNCVVQQLQATHNLEMAKTFCTQQATSGM